MPTQTRLLELALKGLEAERSRIADEIADIQARLSGGVTVSTRSAPVVQPAVQSKKRGLSAAGRKKISEMMKARWAVRRKAVQSTVTASAKSTKKRGGLTAAGRKALSEAMKRRWAERRKKAAKAKK